MGRTGVTNRDSKVPRSYSRAMITAVSSTPMMVMVSMIRPGMKYQVLELASLYQIRLSTDTIPMPRAFSCRVSQAAKPLST